MSDIRTWKKQKVKLVDVNPMPGNPRSMKETNREALKQSMDRFGYLEPIVWNKKTGHIVGGHQRYAILAEAGVKEATMVVVDISAEDEMAANITLNNPEIEGEWDNTAVELMDQLSSAMPDLAETLRIGELKIFVEGMNPKKIDDVNSDKDDEVSIEDLSREFDTKCPCCKHAWKIDAKDVTVEQEVVK